VIVSGSYVRIAPPLGGRTSKGTVRSEVDHNGKSVWLFEQDSRFSERLPEFYVYDGQIEECDPPSDAEVAAINAILAANPPGA
jgi:hypothetical protein